MGSGFPTSWTRNPATKEQQTTAARCAYVRTSFEVIKTVEAISAMELLLR